MAVEEDVLFSVKAHIGTITLNRPNALNALSFSMFKAILKQLKAWQQDIDIHAVVIKAVPARVFCAGGDVRWVYDEGRDNPSVPLELFYHEYRLNYLTSVLGKPYIALMDGLTIGGGVGVTLHGSHRVASERFQFSMPEASIGFFPDIGASHLLSACDKGVGIYLGLTGQRVNAADAKALNFVDYTVSSEAIHEIFDALLQIDLSTDADAKVSACLQQYQKEMPPGRIQEEAWAIARCFENKKSIDEIFEALKKDESAWARVTHDTLLQQSPKSLHISLEQLIRAKGLSLKECLAMDYRLAYHFLHDHDFYEGVRARLVDKDKQPKWQPEVSDLVRPSEVATYFDVSKEVSSLW